MSKRYKSRDNDENSDENNKYFNADLDEDIDDVDIGWNSDDDDKYGMFFQSNEKKSGEENIKDLIIENEDLNDIEKKAEDPLEIGFDIPIL